MGAPEFITLAHILRPQGRRGEVLAELLTDFPEQFTAAQNLLLATPSQRTVPVQIEQFWLPTGRNAGRVVLKLAGTDSITDAEKLAGHDIQLSADERMELEDDTFYVDNLIGCKVLDGEVDLGDVIEVQSSISSDGRRMMDSASLFVVRRPNGTEMLIPFAKDFVQSINVEQRLIVMILPAGLAELNG
ncbi:MAG: ribosome maturation factor RimM [Janthinobacterium lividum]